MQSSKDGQDTHLIRYRVQPFGLSKIAFKLQQTSYTCAAVRRVHLGYYDSKFRKAHLSPSFINRGRSLSSFMTPVPSGSKVVKALLIMSSGSVPCMFSENRVMNMVKLTAPVASPSISSMYSSVCGLPKELNISCRSLDRKSVV